MVVLDHSVIGIAGEGERIQAQRIDLRELQQSQVRPDGLQVRPVAGDQVVAERVLGAIDERIQLIQCGGQVATAEEQALAGIGAASRKGVDAAVSPPDLEVHGKAVDDDVIMAGDRRHDPDAIGITDTSVRFCPMPLYRNQRPVRGAGDSGALAMAGSRRSQDHARAGCRRGVADWRGDPEDGCHKRPCNSGAEARGAVGERELRSERRAAAAPALPEDGLRPNLCGHRPTSDRADDQHERRDDARR